MGDKPNARGFEKKVGMKIVVAGTRGIPNIPGGVETHCEELYPRLVSLGCEVLLIRRSCYVSRNNKINSYKGIVLKDLYAPKQKTFEAFLHTFLAVFYAKKTKTDILHIHAIGPSIMTPLARLLGLKVVVTHHGQDYYRHKWGKIAKAALKIGERLSAKYANELIVISENINTFIQRKYKRFNANLIHNGVNIPVKSPETTYIQSLDLTPQKYIFTLGRFVKEKGFHGLIEAFTKLNTKEFKLVIAGDADHPDAYSENLKQFAKESGVILTGFIKGEKLNELFSNAKLFVLPSFHEGLPISLLEAMSYDMDVLISDIPANLEIKLPDDYYFKCGDWNDLKNKMEEKLCQREHIKYDLSMYNWDTIAEQTIAVYQRLAPK